MLALEIYHLLKELKLDGSRLSKIYEDDEKRNVFLFELHVFREGTKWLQIIVPDAVYIAEEKITPATPPGFCQFLRKKLIGMKMFSLDLVDFERILLMKFGLGDGHKFNLYIEMFAKGNMILTDNANKILGTWKTQEFGTRQIRGGNEYQLPPRLVNTPKITLNELKELLSKNDKEIVRFVATRLGLGGIYSELLLEEAKITKHKTKLTEKEIELLHKTIKKLFLKTYAKKVLETSQYEGKNLNEGIMNYYSKKLFLKQDNTARIDKIKEMQKQKLAQYETEAVEFQKIGETIYENYTELSKILQQANNKDYSNCEKLERRKIKIQLAK